jgi:UDP-glucose 4-epimerase
METNARGTLNLATQAAQAGVHRFIFLSSVKVNGEVTSVRPINSTDNPQPGDAYGESKWEGEKFALMVAARSAMEVAIIRSPLIYGPGVKANFLRLMQWVDNERLVPLGAVDNKRSLVSVWNLCDLILHLLTNPAASRRIWMVSDGEDLSTPQLIRRLATAMGRRVRMLPVPVSVLRCLGSCLGYGEEVTRLCGSLTVDIAQTRSDLGWSPPLSVDEALERTVRWYLSAAASHVD